MTTKMYDDAYVWNLKPGVKGHGYFNWHALKLETALTNA